MTGAWWSENVAKQNPLESLQTFTLRSSAPLIQSRPSGDHAQHVAAWSWPCCLSTKVSARQSQTTNWPNRWDASAILLPVESIDMASTDPPRD